MADITCFVNTSKDKDVLFLKPRQDGLLKANPFLNLVDDEGRPAKAETEELVKILRLAFQKGVSYEMTVPVTAIRTTKSGSLAFQSTLKNVIKTWSIVERHQPKPLDSETTALVGDILSELENLPTRASAPVVEDDGDEPF